MFSFVEFEDHQPTSALEPLTDISVGSLPWLKTQAETGTPIWAVCLGCSHSRLLDPGDLIAVMNPDTASAADRLRCRGCGSKACKLEPATPIPDYFA